MSESTVDRPPDEIMSPSEKAAKACGERIQEFCESVHRNGPDSDFGQKDEVAIRSEAGELDGKTGRVIGQSYIGSPDSPLAGEVCRGVELENGAVVCVKERSLRGAARTTISMSGVSQEKWDRIFGSKPRKKARSN